MKIFFVKYFASIKQKRGEISILKLGKFLDRSNANFLIIIFNFKKQEKMENFWYFSQSFEISNNNQKIVTTAFQNISSLPQFQKGYISMFWLWPSQQEISKMRKFSKHEFPQKLANSKFSTASRTLKVILIFYGKRLRSTQNLK